MVCIASSRMPTPMRVITLKPSSVESSAGQDVKSRFRTSPQQLIRQPSTQFTQKIVPGDAFGGHFGFPGSLSLQHGFAPDFEVRKILICVEPCLRGNCRVHRPCEAQTRNWNEKSLSGR